MYIIDNEKFNTIECLEEYVRITHSVVMFADFLNDNHEKLIIYDIEFKPSEILYRMANDIYFKELNYYWKNEWEQCEIRLLAGFKRVNLYRDVYIINEN